MADADTSSMYDGRTVVITGIGGDLGSAVANRFAERGARIFGVEIDERTLDAALARLPTHTDRQGVVADVRVEQEVASYVGTAQKAFGRIDIFFNNAGVLGPLGPITECDFERFRSVFSVNVFGMFLGLKHVTRAMHQQRAGSVINTASIMGVGAVPDMSAYVSSKHAVIGLTRAAALEGAKLGTRVNCVLPGPVAGRMMKSIYDERAPDNPDAALGQAAAIVPMGRLADPSEIASVVEFLGSDAATYVTGACYTVDGGLTAA